MTTTNSAAPAKSGAKSGSHTLILAHRWADAHPCDRTTTYHYALRQFSERLDELAGQLIEPGYPLSGEADLFGEGDGVSPDMAHHIVARFVAYLLDGQQHNLEYMAELFMDWLEQEVGDDGDC